MLYSATHGGDPLTVSASAVLAQLGGLLFMLIAFNVVLLFSNFRLTPKLSIVLIVGYFVILALSIGLYSV